MRFSPSACRNDAKSSPLKAKKSLYQVKSGPYQFASLIVEKLRAGLDGGSHSATVDRAPL